MNTQQAYLVDALLALAATYPAAVTIAEIARQRQLPAAFLGRLLAAAARRGLVATLRGPRGGVRLVRPPQTITLAEILDSPAPPTTGSPATRWLEAALARSRDEVLATTSLAVLLAHDRDKVAAGDWSI